MDVKLSLTQFFFEFFFSKKSKLFFTRMRKIKFPIVDIRPLMFPEKAFTSEIGSVVDKVREASRSHGFFHVVGK